MRALKISSPFAQHEMIHRNGFRMLCLVKQQVFENPSDTVKVSVSVLAVVCTVKNNLL